MRLEISFLMITKDHSLLDKGLEVAYELDKLQVKIWKIGAIYRMMR